MGTSTARRGPGTPAWRSAKAAATRYLAPEDSHPVTAREVASRYVKALRGTSTATGQDILASFSLTRKAAQELGAFLEAAAASGWERALAAGPLEDLAGSTPEEVIPVLVHTWQQEDGSLEAAVVRTALTAVLNKLASAGGFRFPPEPILAVRDFLAVALYHRLLLDLGESLEAAAPGWAAFREGLAHLEDDIADAAAAPGENPPGPGQWPGLAGWVWASRTLTAILRNLEGDKEA